MILQYTLTRTILTMASEAKEEVAVTEMGISPRTKGMMGNRMVIPSWLPTDTWRVLAIVSPSLSAKTNWKESLSATITMTWQQKMRAPQRESTRPDHVKGIAKPQNVRGNKSSLFLHKYNTNPSPQQYNRSYEDYDPQEDFLRSCSHNGRPEIGHFQIHD